MLKKQQCERNRVFRQADLGQCAGETQAVQQPKQESHHPGPASRNAFPALAPVNDLDCDKQDAQRNLGLDRCLG